MAADQRRLGRPEESSAPPRERNNLGVLRLLLASLVVIGHAPEQIDGDRLREPLFRLVHTVTLGGVAVDAFFVLSGYLIAESAVRAVSISDYFVKRVARIYPAFVVAFLISVFLLGPMVGTRPLDELPRLALRLVALQGPPLQATQLVGLPYPDLNGSMWTLAYEFRCYVLIAVLQALGLLRRPGVVLSLLALGLALTCVSTLPGTQSQLARLSQSKAIAWTIGDLASSIRLTTIFLAGARLLSLPRRSAPTPQPNLGAWLRFGRRAIALLPKHGRDRPGHFRGSGAVLAGSEGERRAAPARH